MGSLEPLPAKGRRWLRVLQSRGLGCELHPAQPEAAEPQGEDEAGGLFWSCWWAVQRLGAKETSRVRSGT